MSYVYKYQDGKEWRAKHFSTQKDLFRFLVENKDFEINRKKSVIKHADAVLFTPIKDERVNPEVTKAIKALYENDKENGVLKRTVLTNTYWWMDSHSDVHIGRTDEREKGVFTDSIANRTHKVYPIDEHKFGLDGRIGKTLKLYEAPISWRALGVGRTGMTEGLFADMEVHRDKNERRYKDYLNDDIDQHSVGMQYVDVILAINDEEEYPKEYANYQKYIHKIGNRNLVDEQGFFFAVLESKLIEYSCVLAGSNELTPTLGVQPSDDADKSDPSGDSQILKALENLQKSLALDEVSRKVSLTN